MVLFFFFMFRHFYIPGNFNLADLKSEEMEMMLMEVVINIYTQPLQSFHLYPVILKQEQQGKNTWLI